MRETKLNELKGVSILSTSFFNRLIRRIECTKPIAGDGISIAEEDNGFKISAPPFEYNVVTLNVCSNGEPATLLVLSPKEN